MGKIHDLLIDTEAGYLAYAVVAAGRFAGLGNRLFAMPWSAFDLTDAENRLIVDVARDKLKAPGFEKYKQWPNFSDSEWGGAIHDYYGCVPYWTRSNGAAARPASPPKLYRPETFPTGRATPGIVASAGHADARGANEGMTDTSTLGGDDMSQVAKRQTAPKYGVTTVSKIVGESVVNRQNEDLGKIHELVIDAKEGHVAYAVLASGGFLGMGNRLFAMPWSAFEFASTEHKLILDVDKEKLKAAPGFDKDSEWPDFADTSWGTSIHEFYGHSPYWKQ